MATDIMATSTTGNIPAEWQNATNVMADHSGELPIVEMDHFHEIEMKKMKQAKALQSILARTVVTLKMDKETSAEDKEAGMAWAAQEENREVMRVSESNIAKEVSERSERALVKA